MQVNKISLKYYVAEEILKGIYSEAMNENVKKLQEVSYDYMTTENILKMYARAFKAEMNKKAAMIVVESLSDEKKRLIKLKYGEQRQLVSMSFALNISVGQLMVWNQSIMEKITQFVMYRLTAEDVFCKKKISGMIEMLNLTIEFFSGLESEYQVRREWLDELKRKKNNYQNLLRQIEKFESKRIETSYKKVIVSKIGSPNSTNKEIAIACKLHKATVGRFLKKFTNAMSSYLK